MRKLKSILNAAERRIKEGAGVSHEEFWKRVESHPTSKGCLPLNGEESKLKLHPEILTKNGQKEFAILPYEEFVTLQERLADAEDVLELRKAKRAEGKKKSIPLAEAKRKLRLR